jgi:hypothetical protein
LKDEGCEAAHEGKDDAEGDGVDEDGIALEAVSDHKQMLLEG